MTEIGKLRQGGFSFDENWFVYRTAPDEAYLVFTQRVLKCRGATPVCIRFGTKTDTICVS